MIIEENVSLNTTLIGRKFNVNNESTLFEKLIN